MRSSSRSSSRSTGSTVGCSSRSDTCRRQSSMRCTPQDKRARPLRAGPTDRVSGKAGLAHGAGRRRTVLIGNDYPGNSLVPRSGRWSDTVASAAGSSSRCWPTASSRRGAPRRQEGSVARASSRRTNLRAKSPAEAPCHYRPCRSGRDGTRATLRAGRELRPAGGLRRASGAGREGTKHGLAASVMAIVRGGATASIR
jgi:hypothetical protein